MSERKNILLGFAEKKEIKYSVSKIKRAKQEEIDRIWDEVQSERLGETNEFIANTFVEKLCDILESTNVIDSGKETSEKLKNRKAFMADVKNMASYFSALIPYIGMLEGGIVLGKDVYDHKQNPRVTEIFEDSDMMNNKYETSYSAEQGNDEGVDDERGPFE